MRISIKIIENVDPQEVQKKENAGISMPAS
jgi:hypothetical protein